MVDLENSSDDSNSARIRAQEMRHRVWLQVALGAAVYATAILVLAIARTSWGSDWSRDSMSMVISMSFGDGMAVLGVLTGAIVAINLIVWQSIRGSTDPHAYAYAQLIEMPTLFVGQGAIFVGISTLIGFAPVTIDLPRMSTVLIACAAVLVLAIHTSEGLVDGVYLEQQVRRSLAGIRIEQLRNVLRRWPLLAGRQRTARSARVRYWLAITMVSGTPLLLALIVRAVLEGDFWSGAWHVVVGFALAMILTVGASSALATIVGCFVTREFGTALYLSFVTASSALVVVLGSLMGVVAEGVSSPMQAVVLASACVMFLLVLALPAAGLAHNGDSLLSGASLRSSVRNTVLKKIRRERQAASGIRTPSVRTSRAGIVARIRRWYLLATGVAPTADT